MLNESSGNYQEVNFCTVYLTILKGIIRAVCQIPHIHFPFISHERGKGKSAHEPKAKRPELILVSSEYSMPRSISTPPGCDASLSQGYSPAVCRWYPFIHLGEGRQSGVKFLVCHNERGLNPRPPDMEIDASTSCERSQVLCS